MAVDAARAKSPFLAVSDLVDPAERATYLDRECGGDAELRARVGALLRANDAAPLPLAHLMYPAPISIPITSYLGVRWGGPILTRPGAAAPPRRAG